MKKYLTTIGKVTMKKYVSMLGTLLLGLLLTTACGSSDDDSAPELERKSLTVENATYVEGTMPAATIHETPRVQMPSTVSKGGRAVIRIARDRNYVRYYISVKGMPGYYVYTPSAKSRITRSDNDEDDWDEITITAPINGDGGVTILTSGEDENGDVTDPYETEINYVDGPVALVRSISYANGRMIMEMKYDSKARLTMWNPYSDGETNVTYNGDGSIKSIVSDGGSWTCSRIKTDASGHILSMHGEDEDYYDDITFTYDAEGHMTQYYVKGVDDGESFTAHYTLTWQSGNLTKVVCKDDEGDVKTYSFTYGNEDNVTGQYYYLSDHATLGCPFGTNLFGRSTSQLATSVTVDDNTTYKFEYVKNESGRIEMQNVTGNGKTISLIYSY
jgi:hypothetical protein